MIRGGKFTVDQVGYPEELDMLRSGMRGCIVFYKNSKLEMTLEESIALTRKTDFHFNLKNFHSLSIFPVLEGATAVIIITVQ